MSTLVEQWDPADVVQDAVHDVPSGAAARLRIDFGAHLEANYQRLVAQLYAITLDSAEAHDVVQDAYSRAWREWAMISRQPDPTSWVRSVAVRSTSRSWRRLAGRFGARRAVVAAGIDPRTTALLGALGRLSSAERRSVVLHHMAGVSVAEIAAIERVGDAVVESRLAAAREVVVEGLADVLPAVLAADATFDDRAVDDLAADALADEEPEGKGTQP